MSYYAISQFNPKHEDMFVFGDPDVYGGVEVAGSVKLFDALVAKGLSPAIAAEPLLYIIDKLPDESERALGITLLTADEAGDAYPSGSAQLATPTGDIGYAFAWEFEQEGDEITEIFVVIEPHRLTSMKAASREEDLGRVLSLNEAVTAQLVLIGSPDPFGELLAAEEAAGPLLREAIDKTDELLLVIAPKEV